MGEEDFDSGAGDVDVHLPSKNYVYVINPMYWVPNDTSNAMSPGDIKLFSNLKSTLVEPLEHCEFTDNYSKNSPVIPHSKTIWNI